MKPCPKYRDQIAWLAMDAVETQPEPELRAHLDSCAACRRYLEEISVVTGSLRAAEPPSGIQPSASFHRRVVGALAAAEHRSVNAWLLSQIRSLRDWRMALPASALIAAVIAVWWVAPPRTLAPLSTPVASRASATPAPAADLEPTFSNYEMAAHQSLDKLDQLLTEQGNRNLPPAPIYTRSLRSRLDAAD